ncbi:hypothetical protein Hanom_Chr01g00060521 [Helianthus anomalus]
MEGCLNNDLGNTHEVVNQENVGNRDEVPVVDLSSGPSDAQVASSGLRQEGAFLKSSKRKSYRKKGRAQKSPSPVGLERPKKGREKETIFLI